MPMTLAELEAHYLVEAEKFRRAAIFIRGDLTAWKHERNVQAPDSECGDDGPPGADYWRADGAINAINQLAFRAEGKRRKYEAMAAACKVSQEELDKVRREHEYA